MRASAFHSTICFDVINNYAPQEYHKKAIILYHEYNGC